jgi:hypothetical protein
MSQTPFEETFDKTLGFGAAALLIVGTTYGISKGGAWLWENGGNLLNTTGNVLAHMQANDPDSYNRLLNLAPREQNPIQQQMDFVGVSSFKPCDKCGQLYYLSCKRISCAPHLYSYCAAHTITYSREGRCHLCFPPRRKRHFVSRRLKAQAALPPAPAKQIAEPRAVETLAPLTVKKRVDEKAQNHKCGREPGSSNKKTRMYLRDYNKCLEAGDSEKDAVDKVTKKRCPTARHSKDFRRSLVALVKKHLGGADKK